MSAVGDRFVSEGVDCEVVWTGGKDRPLILVQHRPGSNCSLGNWYQERRAKRVVTPRAPGSTTVDSRAAVRPDAAPISRRYFTGVRDNR